MKDPKEFFEKWQEEETYAYIYRFVNPDSPGCEDRPEPVDPKVESAEKQRVADFLLECALEFIEHEGLEPEYLDWIQVIPMTNSLMLLAAFLQQTPSRSVRDR